MTAKEDKLSGAEILVGVAGGIAAYKSAELVSLLVQQGAGVSVILSHAATNFIGATTFEALTDRPVYSDQFAPKEHFRGEHIGLAQRAEIVCIAPATAHIIGRLAHGLADDLLSTVVLATEAPICLAPAMNSVMWSKPAVQRNVAQLEADGMKILQPESGWLSCRQTGQGRMGAPEAIAAEISKLLAETDKQP